MGVLYAIVPELWNMRESAWMLYLADFAPGAFWRILTAWRSGRERECRLDRIEPYSSRNRRRVRRRAVIVPRCSESPDINPWDALSILVIFRLLRAVPLHRERERSAGVRAVMVGLILFDLSSADWTARNRIEVARTGIDHLDRIMSARGAAQFLKAQADPFRIRVQADPVPNIGDLFGVPIVDAASGATLPTDYTRIMGYTDLLNVRYILTSAKEQRPGAVYQDAAWKVYESPSGYPRAWIVHETMVEPSAEQAAKLLGTPGFDARRTALIDVPVALEPLGDSAQESARVASIAPNRMELEVDVQNRALMVLSENYYPGWRATINDQAAPIYRVDSALRGVIVPRGHSRVVLNYAPQSVYWGGLLTLTAFFGTLLAMWLQRR